MVDQLELIKKLRAETSAGVMDIKDALIETGGDIAATKKLLFKRGVAKAEKKSERASREGRVEAYIHANGKLGAIVALSSETDFVARNDEFKSLARELAMQVAASDPEPKSVDDLLAQDYIRGPEKKVGDLITEAVAKMGENIKITDFKRFKIG